MTNESHDPQGIRPSGFFVLRTPLAPLRDLTAWSEGLRAPDSPKDADLSAALAEDRKTLRQRLAAYANQPEIREALFVASPSLDESIGVWLADPESARGQRVERALVRYVARLAGRATPFGLFAGCSVGSIRSETRLEITTRSEYRRHTRLDTDYLFTLVDALARDPALRGAFRYLPNSSLYRCAERVRYVESRLKGTLRSYHLVAVEVTDALEAALSQARDGASLDTLAAALVADDVSQSEAEGYVAELIDCQILVPDIAVPVTGPEPTHVLAAELAGRAETTAVGQSLTQAQRMIEQIDAGGLGATSERYRALARSLEPLPGKIELSRLFQVDMTKPAPQATLGAAVLAEIVAGIELLHRIGQPRRDDSLVRFREAFEDRYEGRDVPLVEALDEESGIGFGASDDTSPLLDTLPFAPASEGSVSWGPRETLLLRKLNEALSDGRDQIALAPEDVEQMAAKDPPPLPDAFAVAATLAASSEQAMDRGDFRVLLGGFSGPSGAPLLGRFCHTDETLRRLVEEHLRSEEARAGDAVFAEIAHLPEGRLGNILLRPVLREYEIAYLGRSGAPAGRRIPVTDLVVSIRGPEIVLRSTRLQRRVIPRLTSAHNFSFGSLGTYRFLCALQRQGVASGAGWDWGPLARAPFLPRVACGRLVLSRSRWNVHEDALKRLGRGDAGARFREVQAWRTERRIPRWVVLADGDNTLPVDLSNALAVESFVHLVKDRDGATLEELFPGPDELCVRGPEGRFVHELIVPFVRTGNSARPVGGTAPKAHRRSPSPAPSVQRSFPPGSEWLYVKLYSGTVTADQVLRELGPVVRRAMSARLADHWFFIRYADSETHLRLRFHGVAEALQQDLWPSLRSAVAPLLEDGRIWRLTLDTYEREVERYGGPDGIELAEQLFHFDSEAVLQIVERLDPGDGGLDERWRLSFRGMHDLLEDLAIDFDARAEMLRALARASAKEFRFDRKVDHQLGETFRKQRTSLMELLDPAREHDSPLSPGLRALRHRSEESRTVVARLKALEAAGRLSVSCRELAKSYLHMHANRLLRSVQRQQEAVLYDLLARHYESAIARKRGRDSTPAATAQAPIVLDV